MPRKARLPKEPFDIHDNLIRVGDKVSTVVKQGIVIETKARTGNRPAMVTIKLDGEGAYTRSAASWQIESQTIRKPRSRYERLLKEDRVEESFQLVQPIKTAVWSVGDSPRSAIENYCKASNTILDGELEALPDRPDCIWVFRFKTVHGKWFDGGGINVAGGVILTLLESAHI